MGLLWYCLSGWVGRLGSCGTCVIDGDGGVGCWPRSETCAGFGVGVEEERRRYVGSGNQIDERLFHSGPKLFDVKRLQLFS